MEGWDNPPPCIHNFWIHLHNILDGKGLSPTSVWLKCYLFLIWILTKSSFSDLSTFSYIFGPAAEPLLGSQGAVSHAGYICATHAASTLNKIWRHLCLCCLDRLECWPRCSPLSLVLSPSMTYGAMSGTSCLYHYRLESTCQNIFLVF